MPSSNDLLSWLCRFPISALCCSSVTSLVLSWDYRKSESLVETDKPKCSRFVNTHTHTHTPTHTHTNVKTVPHAILLSWRRAKVLVKVFVFEQEFLFECVALCVFPTMGKVTQKLLMEITVWEFLIFDQNLDQTGAIRTYEWINCSWKISMDPLSYPLQQVPVQTKSEFPFSWAFYYLEWVYKSSVLEGSIQSSFEFFST